MIDGGWSDWSSWSGCGVLCSKTRSRSCSDPEPFNGGSNCTGDKTEMIKCCGDDCIDSSLYKGCYSASGVTEAEFSIPDFTVCDCVSYCRNLDMGYKYAAAKGG